MDTNERARVLEHARSIITKATADGRPNLTDYEEDQVRADLARIKELDSQWKAGELARKVKALGYDGDDDPDRPRPSVFSAEAKDGIANALRTGTSYRTEVSAKALTTNTMLPASGSYVEPGLHPNSQFPLSTLFAQQAADGPLVRYYRMTAGTANIVAEGAAKPDAGVAVTAVDLGLSKIAATAQVSTEMQSDAGYLVQAVEAEMQQAIVARENQLVTDTFASTSGVLTGSGATTDVVDLVAAAVASMEAISGVTPVAFIAHPSVVSTVRQAKASGSQEYILDPTQKAPQTLHGVPVYSTPATAAGTAWLASGPGVTIYRRGGVLVNIGTNADDLIHNLSTIVAEERVGVAVTRPSSIYKLTLT